MRLKTLYYDLIPLIIIVVFFIAFIPLFQYAGLNYRFINFFLVGIPIILLLTLIVYIIIKFTKK